MLRKLRLRQKNGFLIKEAYIYLKLNLRNGYIVTRKSLVIPLPKSHCRNMNDKRLQSYHCEKIFS